MKPADLILRCYGYERKDRTWYAVCIDLNLDAEGRSIEDVKLQLFDAIYGYLETIAEVDDPTSLVRLIRRPAPFKDRFFYQLIHASYVFRRWIRRWVTFEEAVPVYPAAHCSA